MKKYAGANNNSGVVCYEIGDDYTMIKFVGSERIYLYTYASAGIIAIEKMKMLAKKGKGLNTYINQIVKEKYERIVD